MLIKIENEIKKSGEGASGQTELPRKKLSNVFNATFPDSLEEQKRIVEILDKSFAQIEKVEAIARQNLTNARELRDSLIIDLLKKVTSTGERITLQELLDRGWIESHLDGNHGGNYPRKNEFVKSGIPYISANCIKGEKVDFSLSKYLTPERASLLKKGIARNNDVLFAHNATVGPVAILKTKEAKIILSTSLTYYRCNQEYIKPEYLAIYMRTKEFKYQYELVMGQSTRNQVPITKQRTFTHFIPSLEDQENISKIFSSIEENLEEIEEIYQRKIEALGELKQSILQKAFTGQLT